MGRIQAQTPLGTRLDFGIQPCYETPGDLRGKNVKTKWLISSESGCSLNNRPKLTVGQPNSSQKKSNVDLSFSEMRRLYSIKFKKAYTYRQRKKKEEMGRVHERNFENSIKFPSNFQFG